MADVVAQEAVAEVKVVAEESSANNPGYYEEPDEATKSFFLQQTVRLPTFSPSELSITLIMVNTVATPLSFFPALKALGIIPVVAHYLSTHAQFLNIEGPYSGLH